MSGREPEILRALADGGLAEGADAVRAWLDACGADALAAAPEPFARGFVRSLAGRPQLAGFLSHRSGILARLAEPPLAERAAQLEHWQPDDPEDLEGALDAMRLLRAEESVRAACHHFGGSARFEEVSDFLSALAEGIARAALGLAERSFDEPPPFVVVGMGKIAGREFTYHSDLDLVFLYEGDAETVAAASRVGQRLISYLTTMTGAGIAYAVDTRLRPSGRQGMLVTSLPAFEQYQREQAQTWEHLAMLRARPIAGLLAPALAALDRVRSHVLATPENPWPALRDMRARVEGERAAESGDAIPSKAGAGGLMDVDFLAGGALLERGTDAYPALPSVPGLLRAAARGDAVEALLADYGRLRRIEAAVRWHLGRGVESIPEKALAPVAELDQAGRSAEALAAELAGIRERVRGAWERVAAAGTIAALG